MLASSLVRRSAARSELSPIRSVAQLLEMLIVSAPPSERGDTRALLLKLVGLSGLCTYASDVGGEATPDSFCSTCTERPVFMPNRRGTARLSDAPRSTSYEKLTPTSSSGDTAREVASELAW